MGKHTRTVTVVGSVAAVGAALFTLATVGADAKGGNATTGGTDAKQNVLQAATCVDADGNPTADNLGLLYNRSGDRVTIAMMGTGGNADDAWMIGLSDNGTLLDTFGASTSDWTVIDNETLSKGSHTLTMVAGSSAGSMCTASASFKI